MCGKSRPIREVGFLFLPFRRSESVNITRVGCRSPSNSPIELGIVSPAFILAFALNMITGSFNKAFRSVSTFRHNRTDSEVRIRVGNSSVQVSHVNSCNRRDGLRRSTEAIGLRTVRNLLLDLGIVRIPQAVPLDALSANAPQ